MKGMELVINLHSGHVSIDDSEVESTDSTADCPHREEDMSSQGRRYALCPKSIQTGCQNLNFIRRDRNQKADIN